MSYPHRFHRAAGPVSVDSIQPWMTFNYLNVIFKLPSDYLKTQLNIQDSRYPRLQVGHYSDEQGIARMQFIASLKQAIRQYRPTP